MPKFEKDLKAYNSLFDKLKADELQSTLEIELSLFKTRVTRSDALRIASRLRSLKYTVSERKEYLLLYVGDVLRLRFEDSDYRDFCKTGVISDAVWENRLYKVNFGKHDYDDYPLRLKANVELEEDDDIPEFLSQELRTRLLHSRDTYQTREDVMSSGLSFVFRYLIRDTFTRKGVEVAITAARQARGKAYPSSGIETAPVEYQIEAEVMNFDHKDSLKTAARHLLQGYYATPLIMKKQVMASVLSDLTALTKLHNREVFDIPKPDTFVKASFPLITASEYTITDKADGVPVQLFVDKSGEGYIVLADLTVLRTDLRFKQSAANSILIGELIRRSKKGKAIFLLLAFDAHVSGNVDIRHLPFHALDSGIKTRLSELSSIVSQVVKKQTNGLDLRVKKFVSNIDLSSFVVASSELMENPEYATDGLIFTPSKLPVYGTRANDTTVSGGPSTRWAANIKWKPGDMNTVDFLVWSKGKRFQLLVGDNLLRGDRSSYTVVPSGYFTKVVKCEETGELVRHGDIVEFKYKDRTWIPMRVRTDKTRQMELALMSLRGAVPSAQQKKLYSQYKSKFAIDDLPIAFLQTKTRIVFCNSRKVLQSTMSASSISLTSLQEGIGSYFDRQSPESKTSGKKKSMVDQKEWGEVKAYHNWGVKNTLIANAAKEARRFYNSKSKESPLRILDLAAGEGNDRSRFMKTTPTVYVGLDLSKKAIRTARERLLAQVKKTSDADQAEALRNMYYLVGDASKVDPINDTMRYPENASEITALGEGFPISQYDMVTMFFAVHYIIKAAKEKESLERLFQFVAKRLRSEGTFTLTFMDNARVTEALQGKRKISSDRGHWVIERSADDKYNNVLISSIRKVPIREHVVDKSLLIKAAENSGFKLVEDRGFEDEGFQRNASKQWGNMKKNQTTSFSRLNVAVVFQKIPSTKGKLQLKSASYYRQSEVIEMLTVAYSLLGKVIENPKLLTKKAVKTMQHNKLKEFMSEINGNFDVLVDNSKTRGLVAGLRQLLDKVVQRKADERKKRRKNKTTAK